MMQLCLPKSETARSVEHLDAHLLDGKHYRVLCQLIGMNELMVSLLPGVKGH